jgi:D-glycero-alpha-D-manno-heptose 1-phosphate guanylyltransferase
MEAIILAGGLGTRLKSVVKNLPKVLAPIGKLPFLEILIKQLKSKGFTKIVLALGFGSDAVIQFIKNNKFDIEVIYVVEDEPLGTGGAIKSAITRCTGDHVYVFNGDTYIDFDSVITESAWNKLGSPIILGVQVNDVARFGGLLINSDKNVVSFAEKNNSGPGLINAGCYILPINIFSTIEVPKKFSIEKDFFIRYLDRLNIKCCEVNSDFIDIGIPEDYYRAEKFIKQIESQKVNNGG